MMARGLTRGLAGEEAVPGAAGLRGGGGLWLHVKVG
jgi:hypothetical protein